MTRQRVMTRPDATDATRQRVMTRSDALTPRQRVTLLGVTR